MGYFAGSSGTNVSAREITELENILFMLDFWSQAREQPHQPSRTDEFSGCSSRRLKLLSKRQKLCGRWQSRVSQTELAAVWTDG